MNQFDLERIYTCFSRIIIQSSCQVYGKIAFKVAYHPLSLLYTPQACSEVMNGNLFEDVRYLSWLLRKLVGMYAGSAVRNTTSRDCSSMRTSSNKNVYIATLPTYSRRLLQHSHLYISRSPGLPMAHGNKATFRSSLHRFILLLLIILFANLFEKNLNAHFTVLIATT